MNSTTSEMGEMLGNACGRPDYSDGGCSPPGAIPGSSTSTADEAGDVVGK